MNKINYILCILAIFFSCGLFAQGSSPVLSIIEPLAKDSVYVQTLTDDDMVNLKITDEERAFSNDYVVSMNELYRQK